MDKHNLIIFRNGVEIELTDSEMSAAYSMHNRNITMKNIKRFMEGWYETNHVEQGKYDYLIDEIYDEFVDRMAESDDEDITLYESAEMFLPDLEEKEN